MYGEAVVTPNMHLHGHLKDYYYFGLRPCTGALVFLASNQQIIVQSKLNCYNSFFWIISVVHITFPDVFSEVFASLDLSNIQRSRISGSLMDTITKKYSLLPSQSKLCVFDPGGIEALQKLYTKLHPEYSNITINSVYKKYSSITLNGKVYR